MRRKRLQLSLFEKVILVNSALLVLEALAGLWITSHSLETHHYLIDTAFIVFATLLILLTNFVLLRTSFRPLYALLTTIRAISKGKNDARASTTTSDAEVSELALAFNTMLDTLEAVRREQTMLIIRAQEDEQRRIALELHDEVGQNLTALLVHTELLTQSMQGFPLASVSKEAREQLAHGLTQVNNLTQQTLESIRTLAQQLRPSVLDDLGLIAAFRWLAEESRQRLLLDISLKIEGVRPSREHNYQQQLPRDYEIALFRVAQESLTNIARHAHAQHISLLLEQCANTITVSIVDDGVGYDTTHTETGIGIFGMKERVAFLGGTLDITSQKGQGTSVKAVLPLTGEEREG